MNRSVLRHSLSGSLPVYIKNCKQRVQELVTNGAQSASVPGEES
jgi:hypothetical protein